MGLSRIFKFFLHRTIELLVIAVLIVLIPNIPPEGSFSKSYKVAPAQPFEGKLALNNKLDDVEIWHKGDLHGAEAFAEFNGQLYTTLHGGDVVKLIGNHITPVVKFGKPCKGIYQEKICGRPLGLKFDKSGTLYVADAYYGIFKVDVNTGKQEKIVPVGLEIEGRKVTLPNSIAISSSGDIYWSDSSTEFDLQNGIFDMLSDGSGRLVHYDAKTRKNTVLIKDIHFANGVILSDDEEFVLVSETGRNRIQRYYLKGPKEGSRDIFISGLPGMPDNLGSDGKGGFLVPLVVPVDKDNPGFIQIFGEFPIVRKLFARVLGLIETGFILVEKVYPNEFSERGAHLIGHFTMSSLFYPPRCTILRVGKNGEILDSLHTLGKKLTGISDVHISKDTLYLGSPFNDYIGRIPLSKIGWEELQQVTSTPKPTTQAPTTSKPVEQTPTTPKPVTQPPTTPKPVTQTPTTPKPVTQPPTTPKPLTQPPTTPKPVTQPPTTPKPVTQPPPAPKPVTQTPTTPKPTTQPPTTPKPVTQPPTTPKPTQAATPKPAQAPAPKPTPAPTPAQTPPSAATPAPTKTPPQAQNVKDQPTTVPVKESPKVNN